MGTVAVPAADLKSLKDAGFTQPSPKPTKPPRISVATGGSTKRGKTHWALITPPDPVAVISLDPGTRQVVDRGTMMGRTILPKYLDHSKREDQATAKKLWQDYRSAIRAIMATRSIRTLVIDTISDCWDLIQLAEFGKLKQNNKFQYGGVNAEFGGLVDEVYYGRPDLNTIYIQKHKKAYVDDKWDGKAMYAAGFSGLDFLVDLSLGHTFTGKEGFGITTLSTEATRFGPEFSGITMTGDDCSFSALAMHIFADPEYPDRAKLMGFTDEGNDPEYWGIRL
jgi:hypothetical protein